MLVLQNLSYIFDTILYPGSFFVLFTLKDLDLTFVDNEEAVPNFTLLVYISTLANRCKEDILLYALSTLFKTYNSGSERL